MCKEGIIHICTGPVPLNQLQQVTDFSYIASGTHGDSTPTLDGTKPIADSPSFVAELYHLLQI